MAPIVEFETNPIGLSFVKAHKKQMHKWTKLEKHSRLGAVDLGDYSCVENDDLIVLALKLGFQETREMCTKLGMKHNVFTNGSWWTESWVHENKIEDHLFGSMKEDEECEYDHTLIDDSSAQSDDKKNYSVGEDNSSMWKDEVGESNIFKSTYTC